MDRRWILRGTFVALMLSAVMLGRDHGAQALQTIPTGSVNAHWPLDATNTGVTPNTTDDVSGNANTASLKPDATPPTLIPGVYGQGLAFDGTSQFLTIPSAASLNPGASSYSVAMWIRPTNTSAQKRLFNKWNTAGSGSGILMDINVTGGPTAAAGALRFRISDGTNNLDYGFAAGLTANVWSHVVGTIDRTAGQLKIYANGVQIGTTQTIPAAMGAITNADEIEIGALNGADFYAGSMDEIAFYNRALTRADVENLYFGGNMSIAVGNPAPVVSQHGLLGQYYNNNAQIANTMTPPGSPLPTISTTATLNLTRLDPLVNFDWGTGTPAAGVNADDFFGVWTGKIRAPVTGNYRFGTISDDGVRLWVNNVLARDDWFDQGPAGAPEMGTVDVPLTAGTQYDIRLEVYERGGGAVMKLYWAPPGGNAAGEVISPCFLNPPPGPAVPTGLTATASATSQTPQVVVSWTAPAGNPAATSYIVSRATAPGGPYTQVGVTTTSPFTDTTVAFGTTYYYTVQPTAQNAILIGTTTAPTGGVTPVQPVILLNKTSGLTTSEAGLNDTFTITVNVSPSGGAANVQITSSAPTEALLSGPGTPVKNSPINLAIPDGTAVGTVYTITVHGENDFVADGPQPYTISFSISGPGAWSTATTGTITGTNSDNDTPGITVTQLSGPTDESGGTATFLVVFDTQPSADTTMSVTSSNTGEATVSPNSLTFSSTLSFPNANGWNTNHIVTVTGIDDALLDFDQPYSISLTVTGGDAVYVAMTSGGPIVRNGLNLDNETIPVLEPVWGGGGGGCGLTGLEGFLILGLAAFLRRKR